MKTKTSANANPEGLHNSPKLSLATSQQGKMLKTLNKFLALVLVVAGLSMVQNAKATNYIHEAVGIYGTSYTTNNTWTETGTVNTGSSCTTTALGGKITVTLNKGFIGANAMTMYGKSNLKVQCSGCKVYRVVFSPDNGNISPKDAASNLSCNGTGSITQSTWWSSSDDGNNSVTFTGLDADINYKIVHLNIYIKYEATAAQATLTPNSVNMSADDAETFTFKLTTNLGVSFAGADYWQNKIETDASSSDIDFDSEYLSGTYSNNSNLSATIYAYNVGTYTAYFIVGRQTGRNDSHSYYAQALELQFTINVADDCTSTTLTFGTAGPVNKSLTAASFTNAATISPSGTGQTITYSSSDTDVAEVNSLTGAVTINGIGTTTITATTLKVGSYCGKTAT